MATTPKTTRTRKKKSSMIEKESLEAHVDLCAERYQRLEEKYQELKELINNLFEKRKAHLKRIPRGPMLLLLGPKATAKILTDVVKANVLKKMKTTGSKLAKKLTDLVASPTAA